MNPTFTKPTHSHRRLAGAIAAGMLAALPGAAPAADLSYPTYSGDASGLGWDSSSTTRLLLGNGTSGNVLISSGSLVGPSTPGGSPSSPIGAMLLGGTNSTVTFDGPATVVTGNCGVNWDHAGTANYSFNIAGGANTHNTVTVSGGAKISFKGWCNMSATSGTGNVLHITGAGSSAGFSVDNNDGFGIKANTTTTSKINIDAGGLFYAYGTGVANIQSTSATEYVFNVDGTNGGATLSTTGIDGTGNTTNGWGHIFNNGTLQFYDPFNGGSSFVNAGNWSSGARWSLVKMEGAVLAYKNIGANVNMEESKTTANRPDGNWAVGNFTWAGNNALRLDNSGTLASDTSSYTLASNLGSNNYTRLEMINGTTSVVRAITVDGDNSGSMLFDGTAATIANGVTLTGSAATLTATGTDSTLTGVVSGTALVKSGAGKLTLLTAPTYTGDTTISEGTLALANANASNETSTVSIADGAKLELGTSVNDTVGKLYINGAQVTSGTWGSRTSGAAHKDDAHFSGAGVLNVTSGTGSSSPYQMWAGSASFTADANADGVANGLAWMLTAGDVSTNACSLLPTPVKDASYLTLHFLRVSDLGPAKLFLEYSNDLGTLDSWHTVDLVAGPFGDMVVTDVPGHATDDVTVKIPTSHASPAGRLFSRLRATEN